MLTLDTKPLENKKNLLAFSAGVDSSALFFLLLKYKIPFDIALVNYGTRDNSDKEEAHAHKLAKQYGIICHSIKAATFTSHFEQNARNFRYDFFDTLMEKHSYDTLLTAHQLNDQLEWFLMRLTKGAGVSELIGLEDISERNGYVLIRPLLHYSKEELQAYLHQHDLPYFVDESNSDEKYERNRFRKTFSDPLIAEFKEGIQRSFGYLKNDKTVIEEKFEVVYTEKALCIVKLHDIKLKSKAVDITLKKLGYLLSSAQRKEIDEEDSLVIGGEWAVEIQEDLVYIAPYLDVTMPKVFKEQCRVNKIPKKIRPYLYREGIILPA